jgi:uncharacterized protein YlxW (UPF0749 family)
MSRSGAEPGSGRRRAWVARALTGALTLVLGFGAAVQVQHTRHGEALTGATQEDLVEILDTQKSDEDSLRQQIADAQQALDNLGLTDADSGRALSQARKRATAIALLNGSVPALGPGVRVTISDPQRRVPPGALLNAVQELRGAGAEAIQVGDVRIVASSYVVGEAGNVSVDGRPVSAPYQMLAIGPAKDLEAALTASGSLATDVSRVGGSAVVQQVDRVDVAAVAGP